MAESSSTVRLTSISARERQRRLEFFFSHIDPAARILDFGCGDGWVGRWARDHGFDAVTGLDLNPPADIVGDIRDWESLGIEPKSFDVVIAFEVVEHGDYAAAIRAMLKPDGRLMATTPVPRWDWVCRIAEGLGVFQRRTSPHSHLVDLRHYPGFVCELRTVRAGIAQWAILRPDPGPAARP